MPALSTAKCSNSNFLVGAVIVSMGLMLLTLKISYSNECVTDEPMTCGDITESFADKVFEQRDGEYIEKQKKGFKADQLTYPAEATVQAPCSANTWWVRGIAGGPESVDQANQACVALGCGPAQCLQKVYTCDGKGKVKSDAKEPKLMCVERTGRTALEPLHFAFCLVSMIAGLVCCCIGCKGAKASDNAEPAK